MIDVTDRIDVDDIPCCPICDQPIMFGANPAIAHECVFMICCHCAQEALEDE